jgi:hypothetical protein
MTEYILNPVSKRLYKKFLSKPSKKNENKYKKYKNRLNRLIEITKKKLIMKRNLYNTKTTR